MFPRLLPGALLVLRDRLPQLAVFLAGKKAELVEPRKVLLRLRKVVHHKQGYPDVLVRSPVLGIEAQRLVVVLERVVEISGFAPGVAEVILRVGVVRVARGNPEVPVAGGLAVSGFDRLLAALVTGVRGARVRRRPGVTAGYGVVPTCVLSRFLKQDGNQQLAHGAS